jgi:hypothetical protein
MSNEHYDEDRQILNEMIGRFSAPSFIRRAKLVETTWSLLVDRCAKVRRDRLTFVGLRLGQIHALAGSWEAVRAWLTDEDDLTQLRDLFDELQPRLRMPLEPTTSKRELRAALNELIEAMEMFNERWARWLAKIDLKAVNQAREDYNRYYLFEKECAVGNARVARIGFTKMGPITLEDVTKQFPLLKLPRFAS